MLTYRQLKDALTSMTDEQLDSVAMAYHPDTAEYCKIENIEPAILFMADLQPVMNLVIPCCDCGECPCSES